MNPDKYTYVSLWVARDKDGIVHFYKNKPKKGDEEWLPEAECRQYLPCYEDEYRSVLWEDEEPTEIEICVKPKEEPIVEKIQVSRNVQDLFSLECVRRVCKGFNGNVKVEFNLEYMRDCDFMAEEGDWICKTASGKWIVKKGGEE